MPRYNKSRSIKINIIKKELFSQRLLVEEEWNTDNNKSRQNARICGIGGRNVISLSEQQQGGRMEFPI